jgi:hypothetical protein
VIETFIDTNGDSRKDEGEELLTSDFLCTGPTAEGHQLTVTDATECASGHGALATYSSTNVEAQVPAPVKVCDGVLPAGRMVPKLVSREASTEECASGGYVHSLFFDADGDGRKGVLEFTFSSDKTCFDRNKLVSMVITQEQQDQLSSLNSQLQSVNQLREQLEAARAEVSQKAEAAALSAQQAEQKRAETEALAREAQASRDAATAQSEAATASAQAAERAVEASRASADQATQLQAEVTELTRRAEAAKVEAETASTAAEAAKTAAEAAKAAAEAIQTTISAGNAANTAEVTAAEGRIASAIARADEIIAAVEQLRSGAGARIDEARTAALNAIATQAQTSREELVRIGGEKLGEVITAADAKLRELETAKASVLADLEQKRADAAAAATTVLTELRGALGRAEEALRTKLEEAKTAIQGSQGEAITAARNEFEQVRNGISAQITEIREAIPQAQQLITQVNEQGTQAREALTRISEEVRAQVERVTSNVPTLEQLAQRNQQLQTSVQQSIEGIESRIETKLAPHLTRFAELKQQIETLVAPLRRVVGGRNAGQAPAEAQSAMAPPPPEAADACVETRTFAASALSAAELSRQASLLPYLVGGTNLKLATLGTPAEKTPAKFDDTEKAVEIRRESLEVFSFATAGLVASKARIEEGSLKAKLQLTLTKTAHDQEPYDLTEIICSIGDRKACSGERFKDPTYSRKIQESFWADLDGRNVANDLFSQAIKNETRADAKVSRVRLKDSSGAEKTYRVVRRSFELDLGEAFGAQATPVQLVYGQNGALRPSLKFVVADDVLINEAKLTVSYRKAGC